MQEETSIHKEEGNYKGKATFLGHHVQVIIKKRIQILLKTNGINSVIAWNSFTK